MARVGGDELEEEEELDVFAIHQKHATHERLRQWRKATLALNATRRFRYTLNLERTEEARNFPSKKAVKHYQQAGTGEIDGYLPPQGFGVGPRKLQGIVKARELSFLHQLGEVSGVAKSLRTNIEEGLSGDTNEILLRKKYFGENNYPRKKQKRFFVFVWETFQDTTLIILILCAAISLITGMTSKGDPCRPGVAQAVSECKSAGVKVCMVTGDNLITAISIARECGIYSDGLAIEGSDFRNYSNEEMITNLKKLQVLARSLPSDKLLLVQKLKENSEVVAVTGDGTNDAPALHEANIGLAMGISGTEVAKESSDVIILDDNFASVVKMMRWGRSVYANIQKFIQFQLTVNVAALAVNFVAAVSNGSVPLQTVQMLWVNLIMDTLGALALATEPPTDDLMSKPSIGLRDPLVTNVMWRNILGQAAFQVMVLLTLFYKGIDLLHLDGTKERKDIVRNTTIFNTFVFCQLFNEINARKPEEYNVFAGILKNRMFVSVVVISIIFQGIMVESLNKFAKTTKLSWEQWLISIGIGFLRCACKF